MRTKKLPHHPLSLSKYISISFAVQCPERFQCYISGKDLEPGNSNEGATSSYSVTMSQHTEPPKSLGINYIIYLYLNVSELYL